MRFVLFGCIEDRLVCVMKLGAKRAELVQKFMPRSRVGIIRNELSRSAPLDHKLTFWCMWNYLGASRTVWLQKFVPRSCVGIFLNERSRSTPLDPKLMFWCVSYYLGAFGPFGGLTKLGAKRAELV